MRAQNVVPFPARDPLKLAAATVAPYVAELAQGLTSPRHLDVAVDMLLTVAERADDPPLVWQNLNCTVSAFLLIAHELGINGMAEEIMSRPLQLGRA